MVRGGDLPEALDAGAERSEEAPMQGFHHSHVPTAGGLAAIALRKQSAARRRRHGVIGQVDPSFSGDEGTRTPGDHRESIRDSESTRSNSLNSAPYLGLRCHQMS